MTAATLAIAFSAKYPIARDVWFVNKEDTVFAVRFDRSVYRR